MGGLANLLNAILEILGLHLAPGRAAAAAVAIFVLLLPWIWRSMRADEAVRILKRASHERREERERQETRALGTVKGNPNGLYLLAQEALRQGRNSLARQAAEQLKETGKLPHEHARLLIQMNGESPKTPEEAGIRAEKFLRAGQVEEAEQILSAGRRRWPDSPVWAEVESRKNDLPALGE